MNALFNTAFFPLFAIVAFIAVVLFVEGLYLLWNAYKGPEATKVEQRLQALSAGAGRDDVTTTLKNRLLSDVPFVERMLLAIPRVHQLDRFIVQSGLNWSVGKLLSLSALFGFLAFFASNILRIPVLVQSMLVIVAGLLPIAYVSWKRSTRLRKIEEQLPDALDLIGRSLRAGHALPSSLKMTGEEMADPIATEFRITHDEINYGVSIQQALTNLGERIPLTDVRYFVVALLIQRDAGGNLTEVLDNLSKLIRNRLKFNARVRVLTTEGRMSAWVLGLMPFALAGLLNIFNPEFISVLWKDPAGVKLTQILLVMMGLGAIWLYKLVKIRV